MRNEIKDVFKCRIKSISITMNKNMRSIMHSQKESTGMNENSKIGQ